jgi:uncharacterized protein GlcG (DUF336 family)
VTRQQGRTIFRGGLGAIVGGGLGAIVGSVLLGQGVLAAGPVGAEVGGGPSPALQPAPPAQALPVVPVLPLALALEAATTAEATCAQQGYRVAVAVVDRGGRITVQLKGDGAGPHTLDSSRRKAYTAASLGESTAELDATSRLPGAQGLREIDEFLLLGGGLPIESGESVVGGIGVGGAPGGHLDEACARAGIERIADRLE